MAHDPKQLTKDTKTVGRAAVEELPGVGALLALVEAASRRNRKKKFDWYAAELVEATGLEDQRALVALIEQNQDEDWCTDGFEEGFRTVMSAVDETAKKCALIMIADYLKRHDAPDRVYRQFATLFSETDGPLLKVAAAIADAAESTGGAFGGFGASSRNPRTYHIICMGKPEVLLQGPVDEEAFFACQAALQRVDLASPFTGSSIQGGETEREELDKFGHCSYRTQVESYQRPLWVRLRRYLAPARLV